MKAFVALKLHYKDKAWLISWRRIITKLLFSVFIPLSLVFITSTGKYLLHDHLINEEISRLDSELRYTSEKLEDLKMQYYTVAEEYLSKEKIKRIIRSVNPIVNDANIDLWTTVLRENELNIYNNFNRYSLNKLNVTQSKYSISPGVALLTSVAAFESDFRMNARSRKDAYGPMQLRNITAKHIGLSDRRNPEDNIHGGASYLSDLLKKYYDYPDQLELALASYNAGSTRVLRDWVPVWGSNWLQINDGLIENGRRFKETRNYVKSIIGLSHLFISGDWHKQDKYFWSSYKHHMKNFDLVNLYDTTMLLGDGNSGSGDF
ncbi:lytic transglycosylase domain-containing protein [candidate division KSB1 bacterium]